MMDIVKIFISILIMPLMIIILIGAVFIGVHEALWQHKKREVDSERQDKI